MSVALAGVFLSSLGLSDPQRISRFQKLQWQPGVQDHRVKFVPCWDIAASLHEFILCMDWFGGSPGVGAYHIFEDDHIAGLMNGIIWLGGNDQRECLKISCHIKLAAVVVAHKH